MHQPYQEGPLITGLSPKTNDAIEFRKFNEGGSGEKSRY